MAKDDTYITMSREQFRKYIEEAYERGKKKGRAEERALMKINSAKPHKFVKLNDNEEFKANIIEE